jgi:hypothetical protein
MIFNWLQMIREANPIGTRRCEYSVGIMQLRKGEPIKIRAFRLNIKGQDIFSVLRF